MSAFPKNVLYYGQDEPLPEQIPLRAGPLALVYEHGGLRSLRFGGHEILRRVYIAVRDHNWGTVPQPVERAADGGRRGAAQEWGAARDPGEPQRRAAARDLLWGEGDFRGKIAR